MCYKVDNYSNYRTTWDYVHKMLKLGLIFIRTSSWDVFSSKNISRLKLYAGNQPHTPPAAEKPTVCWHIFVIIL